MTDMRAFQKAFASLPHGAVEAEVNAESHGIGRGEVHGGAVTGADQSEDQALYVRVSGDRTGYSYTQDLCDDPGKLLSEAYENGRFSESPSPEEIRPGFGRHRHRSRPCRGRARYRFAWPLRPGL